MHDGAQAHCSIAVRGVLNNTYQGRWTDREEPTAWPLRSPDLNPLDSYLWEHLKPPVYAALVENEKALHHCIVDACETIRHFERMRRSLMRRVQAFAESHGHFEHLLQIILSAITKKFKILYFSFILCE
jgi:hypothetical protein